MSAWLVSNEHINVLVHAMGECGPDPTSCGRMLLLENHRSLHARYGDPIPGITYTYREPARAYSAVEVIKAIDCYEYQSCEHNGWPGSAAKAACDRLRADMSSKLPGWEEAPWGIEDPAPRKVVERAPRHFAVALMGVPKGAPYPPMLCLGMVEALDEAAAHKRVRELFDQVTSVELKDVTAEVKAVDPHAN